MAFRICAHTSDAKSCALAPWKGALEFPLHELFMANLSVQVGQRGLFGHEPAYVVPGEGIDAAHPAIDRAGEPEVLRRIDRPAMTAEVFAAGDREQSKEFRILVEVGGHVHTLVGLACLARGVG